MLHSDSWKQFKIKDIASIGRGRVISSVEISQQDNPLYPVYSSQTSNEGIMGYLDNFMFEGEYINWTTDGANAGTVFYRDGKFNCTNVCGLLKLGDEFDTYFVSLVLAEATKKYVSTNLANPKLMNNTMGSIQIRLPKLKEQKSSLFNLTQEQANARLSVKKLRDEYALYRQDGEKNVDVTKQVEQAMSNMGKKVLGGYSIKEFLSSMIRVRGEFQSMQTAIETMV